MIQNTLYWHDYETFGLDPARDRPVQFAGIRTDEDLNIIGEPLNIMARPAPDTLPHPISSLITGITPQQALEQGLPEAEFIARILEELSQPGRITSYNVCYTKLLRESIARYLIIKAQRVVAHTAGTA